MEVSNQPGEGARGSTGAGPPGPNHPNTVVMRNGQEEDQYHVVYQAAITDEELFALEIVMDTPLQWIAKNGDLRYWNHLVARDRETLLKWMILLRLPMGQLQENTIPHIDVCSYRMRVRLHRLGVTGISLRQMGKYIQHHYKILKT